MNIGDRIKQRREHLNMSQEELARKVGYKSRSSINKIELDGRGLPQSKIVAFATALETTPAYLMGWNDDSVIKCTDDSLKKSISNISRETMKFSSADKIFIDMVYEILKNDLEKSKLDELTKKVRENLPANFGMPKTSTLAAHFEGEEFTESEFEEIKQFAEFVKNKRK